MLLRLGVGRMEAWAKLFTETLSPVGDSVYCVKKTQDHEFAGVLMELHVSEVNGDHQHI
jgi:hypothetical protein